MGGQVDPAVAAFTDMESRRSFVARSRE